MKRQIPYEKSIAYLYPDIIKYWHPTKNTEDTPENTSPGYGCNIWWICEQGHEWQAQVKPRIQAKGSGCPICMGRKLLTGVNDLATTSPHLVSQFHPTKNNGLTPQTVITGSKKPIWWLGDCGHEWERTPQSIKKNNNTNDCPYCKNRLLLPGFNDLATTNPEIAKEWHPTKNGTLTPKDVMRSSQKRVIWIGPCGHEWDATVSNYVNNHNCPYCANIKVLKSFNDLATTHPELAKEWHPDKNNNLTPQDITAGSNAKIWWLGSCGHEWQAAPNNRQRGEGCPYCASKRIIVGFNDLASTYPELAKEWHPTKNGNLKPTDVMPFSTQKVWWLGSCGHEWFTQINGRHQQTECPICNAPNKLFARLKTKYTIKHISDMYYEVISNANKTALILTYTQLSDM